MRAFSDLSKLTKFHDILAKLTIGEKLNNEEKGYILACAILFSQYYQNDRRYTSYIEIAYYIILKYSVLHEDYEPLYDFSINFGYYPVAKNIYELSLIENMGIQSVLNSIELNTYKHNGYIETIEQKNSREKIINDERSEACYIAPTSFGKSSIMLDYIKMYERTKDKICIIVPSRSLLMQTYRMIKEADIDRKIIIHDEMYSGEDKFISIFTQERTLRMIERHGVEFDLLFIDEAHNIFKKDNRSILLARAIKLAKLKNSDAKIIYLSPLISETHNLKLRDDQTIDTQRISFNIKEPEIFELSKNGVVSQYNRFLNEFYEIDTGVAMIDYVHKHSKLKNFMYLNTPRKIEMFANELGTSIAEKSGVDKISEIVSLLEENVHEDFYAISLLKKGIVYLHGKLPDLIKEYLESKFKEIPELNYVVANTVILEGMNLPIDTLFVLSTDSLHGKELTNLIGRVNRLNNIFSTSENNLDKLLPQVHFINSSKYNRKDGNMKNKIELLRKRTFTDELENPVLKNFDIDKVKNEGARKKIQEIIDFEEYILSDPENEVEQIKKYLVKEGFTYIYEDIEIAAQNIHKRINSITSSKIESTSLLDKIFIYFIYKINTITDFEVKRLQNKESRIFYENHIRITHMNTLKENILSFYRYFEKRIEDDNALFYIGQSFGEVEKQTEDYKHSKQKVYVNLSQKSPKQLVNLAIIKLELENQFIHYKLNKFIEMLHDFELINNDVYNSYVYGTTDINKIHLARYGLSMSLINRLESHGQLSNISLDAHNNLISNEAFKSFTSSVDDFFRYEILRNF